MQTRRCIANLLAVLCALGPLCNAAWAAAAEDQAAPPLVVTTLDGQSFDLAAERGHVVVINFWATWCPPCRSEMPMLDAFARRHAADGVVLLGVSVDRRRDRRVVEEVARPFAFRVAIADGASRNGFGPPQALPMTYVLDAAGTVRFVFRPGRQALTDVELETAVVSLLRAPAPQP